MLEKTFEESSSKNSLDIMKLSFDLVKNIEKEEDFAIEDQCSENRET